MTYASAVQRLHALAGELFTTPGQPRRKFELSQMRLLMKALGDPQATSRSVLIAGTNGKGSTAATLASIDAAAGYRVGLYTSPHLVRVNERMQILGREGSSREPLVVRQEIADNTFATIFGQVEAASIQLVKDGTLPAAPSYFETVTAMAFVYFAQEKVDLAVLEVGMGGRLDATNIVNPMLSVITDISLDHMEWLGPTIGAIAREKAGILREHGTMVTLPQHPEANQVLGEIAVPLQVKGINAAEYVPSHDLPQDHMSNRYSVDIGGEPVLVDSPLAGKHQQRNIALAVAAAGELRACHGYDIENSQIAAGIHQTVWPGRLEHYPATDSRAEVLLDVGHNPAGAWALRSALSQWPETTTLRTSISRAPISRTLVFSCLRDKPVDEMVQILFPLFDRIILTTVDSPRSTTLDELRRAAEPTGALVDACAAPLDALDLAAGITLPGGLVVVTGSVLLVGTVRGLLAGQSARDVSPEQVHVS